MGRSEIQGKIDVVRDNLARLAQIPQSTFEEFSSDFRNLDSAQYRLQTSIQGLMDLGSHLCAALGLPAPSMSRDVLQALESAGHLPTGATDRSGVLLPQSSRAPL